MHHNNKKIFTLKKLMLMLNRCQELRTVFGRDNTKQAQKCLIFIAVLKKVKKSNERVGVAKNSLD